MPAPLMIGAARIERIIEQDRLAYMPFNQFFPAVTAEMVEQNRTWLEPDYREPISGKVVLTIQSYVVRAGGLTILVDSCVGNQKQRPTRPLWHMMASDMWHKNLAALDLTVADIDVVMCTHLHVDHVGWNTKLENGRWVPTFPKARYLFADKELAFWTKRSNDDPASCPWVADSVVPIVEANRAEIITSSLRFSEDIHLVPTPGHTIDHFSVEVGDRKKASALITGDMVHSPIQVVYPELGMASDYDSRQAGETRRRIFAACCDTDTVLCTAHFPGNPIGRVKREGSAFRFFAEEIS